MRTKPSKILYNPLLYLISKMWHFSKGNRKKLVIYVLLSVCANVVMGLQPLMIGFFMDKIQLMGLSMDNLWYFFGLLLVLPVQEVVFWVLHGTSRVLENLNGFYVRAAYKNYLLAGVFALPLEWHSDHHSGDTIDKIEKGTTALFSFCCRTFEIISSMVTLCLAIVTLCIYNSWSGISVIVVAIITFLLLLQFDKRIIPGVRAVNNFENKTSARIFDALSNVTTVIILRVESLVLKSINTHIQSSLKTFSKNSKLNETKWFVASFMGKLAVIIALGIYLYTHARRGGIMVGTLFVLYGYTNYVRESFFKFANLYNEIVRYRVTVGNAEDLSEAFNDSDEVEDKHLPQGWKQLGIKNLSFSYGESEGANLHLSGVSMNILHGQKIALIGESGGGKTTFLKVLRDLYHTRSLELSVDGKSIPPDFSEISESIALVPQDPEIFTTTIRENITLGVEYTDQHVKTFTDMAAFTEVIERLPHKLESSIVEKGVNLSGGERQRLALSRGLLASADKDIVLLDEPTSSVDFHNELNIYKNIFKKFSNKTIISSIHRLHLLNLFDVIYFFKDGKILVSGSFEDLKANSRDFQNLWEKYIKTRDSL